MSDDFNQDDPLDLDGNEGEGNLEDENLDVDEIEEEENGVNDDMEEDSYDDLEPEDEY